MPDKLDSLVANIKSKELALRLEAVLELGRLKDARAIPPLAELLSDPELKSLACWALGRIGKKQAVPKLLLALIDDNALVRCESVLALVRIKDRRAAKPIARLMAIDPEPTVRAACADALVIFPSKGVLSALEKVSEEDESEPVRERAAKAIADIKLNSLGITRPKD